MVLTVESDLLVSPDRRGWDQLSGSLEGGTMTDGVFQTASSTIHQGLIDDSLSNRCCTLPACQPDYLPLLLSHCPLRCSLPSSHQALEFFPPLLALPPIAALSTDQPCDTVAVPPFPDNPRADTVSLCRTHNDLLIEFYSW